MTDAHADRVADQLSPAGWLYLDCDPASGLDSQSMETLRVPEALRAVAGRCSTLVGEVAAGSPPALQPSNQPSSAACSAGHVGVVAVGAASATRMRHTGTALSAVKIAYDDNEAHSTAKLRAVGERIV